MDKNGVQLVCFTVCGQKYAFNMDNLVEIVHVRHTEIAPCLSALPLVRGKWAYRGNDVYIIDLRDLFELEDQRPEQENASGHDRPAHPVSKTILVVKIREQIFGLLTDTVLHMHMLKVFYEYPVMISTLPRRYFAGVTILDRELVLLLAIENFINGDELESLLRLDAKPEEAEFPTQAEE
ncbi:hypothetical protein CSB45_03530 [candidate division KSB3 bacterium]|uniref:CheW-like domain-containing protein n=1 Tax=candidate division KSB3 bacterium TaxID=2044937 RepID=A0A2G6E9I2_9BACT|nr:MAG: hypothetical protein CSB45_03530 [candidate division KSB3 bacterium]PIE29565.1 MAG: hypothetical protein CSA57_08125 [candidate division KSB3 bacterium]